MTREELSKAFPPIPLSTVREGLKKAREFAKTYESRVRPYYPEDNENSTSPELYAYLESLSDAKEAKLKRMALEQS